MLKKRNRNKKEQLSKVAKLFKDVNIRIGNFVKEGFPKSRVVRVGCPKERRVRALLNHTLFINDAN